jgi:uncharacterized cupin superfamily protein
MGITHFDEARPHDIEVGHIKACWTDLGRPAGSVNVGVRRIQVPAGSWSTPAHEHGREEEIFYVLSGRGMSWQRERTSEIRAGDCIVYLPRHGAHSLHALEDLDVLAFGPRFNDEGVGFPRLGLSLVGSRAVQSLPYTQQGVPIQFAREAELGPPELPDPGERPPTIANVGDLEPESWGHGRVATRSRDLGEAVGSRTTGINYVEVEPGMWATPPHCHSLEEELFVVLAGDGVLVLNEDETAVREGHVVARPAGTGVAHAFRAGDSGLTFLAYGTREPGDTCYYPRSEKIAFRGLGVIGRLQPLDYWDGED